jgi:hypothetical protein
VGVLAVASLGVCAWREHADSEAAEARLELEKLELQKVEAAKEAWELRHGLNEGAPAPRMMGDFPPWYGRGPQPALLPTDSTSTTSGARQFKLEK